jgi:hypothetical protein
VDPVRRVVLRACGSSPAIAAGLVVDVAGGVAGGIGMPVAHRVTWSVVLRVAVESLPAYTSIAPVSTTNLPRLS